MAISIRGQNEIHDEIKLAPVKGAGPAICDLYFQNKIKGAGPAICDLYFHNKMKFA